MLAISSDKRNTPYPITIDGRNTSALIDSGGTVNVISNNTLQSLGLSPDIKPFKKKVFAFGTNSPLPIHHCFTTRVSTAEGHYTKAQFIINPNPCTTILGHDTALSLNLL